MKFRLNLTYPTQEGDGSTVPVNNIEVTYKQVESSIKDLFKDINKNTVNIMHLSRYVLDVTNVNCTHLTVL
jgi:hypothetical protein